MIATEAIVSKPTTLKIKFSGQRLEAVPSVRSCELGSNSVQNDWGNNMVVHDNDQSRKRKLQKGFSKSFDAKMMCASRNQKESFRVGFNKRKPGELESPEEKRRKMERSMTQQCSVLLKELMKHPAGWVFNQPVDPVALAIPDYFDVIKNPMDLGTIKCKLQKNTYHSSEDFAADIRLTFANAMLYNPPSNSVHKMAEELNGLFELRWKSLEEKWNPERLKVGQARTVTLLIKEVNETRQSASKMPLVRSISLPRKVTESEGKANCLPSDGRANEVKDSEQPQNCTSKFKIKNLQKGTSGGGNGHCIVSLKLQSSGSFRCSACGSIKCQCSLSSDSYNASASDVTTERSLDHVCTDASKLDSQARSTMTSRLSKSDPYSDGAVSASDDGTACLSSQCITPTADALSMEGLTTPVLDVAMSPKKALRAAMLKTLFAETILRAQQKTLLDQGDKVDPQKMQQEKEKLERRQREEKAKIEAQIRAAEVAARRKAEIELREQREREREAARIALQKMEKTVDIEQNADILEELEILSSCTRSNPLEQFGLYIKDDIWGEEDEEAIAAVGGEEGEIC